MISSLPRSVDNSIASFTHGISAYEDARRAGLFHVAFENKRSLAEMPRLVAAFDKRGVPGSSPTRSICNDHMLRLGRPTPAGCRSKIPVFPCRGLCLKCAHAGC